MSSLPNHEIPTYSLFIHPEDLQELRSDIWCDDPIPAKLKVVKKSYDVDIAYRGEHTRRFLKKSYRINFFQPGFFMGSKEIHLNAEYIDHSFMRNKLSFEFFRSIGTHVPTAKHIFLKLNGAAAGIYLQLESVDELFLQKRGLPNGPIYYAVDNNANFSLINEKKNDAKKALDDGYERKCGSEKDDSYLRELVYKINTTPRTDFGKEILHYVNVEQYLHWLEGVICTQNFDAFVHNYALYRNSETGQFEMIPWDYDATWGRDCNGKIMEYDYIPITGYNTLTARILDVPEFRFKYRKSMEEILESKFTPSCLEPLVTAMYKAIRPFIPLDPYKNKYLDKFDAEYQLILQFINDRNEYLKNHLTDLK